jgi:2-phospho-L-lactate guanylyltransferase
MPANKNVTFGLIPVKQFSRAKERLTGLLSLAERSRLALAMYQDVLDAVMSARRLDSLVVISNDALALTMAEERGATIIEECEQNGQSPSVDHAIKTCMAMGATRVLSLPIDIPLVTADDIDEILGMDAPSPSVLLTPSWDGQGTNALLRTPPDVIQSQFGSDSFRAHTQAAQAKGVPYTVCRMPRIALDIDTPEDLALFAAEERATRAYGELIKMNVLGKLYDQEKR